MISFHRTNFVHVSLGHSLKKVIGFFATSFALDSAKSPTPTFTVKLEYSRIVSSSSSSPDYTVVKLFDKGDWGCILGYVIFLKLNMLHISCKIWVNACDHKLCIWPFPWVSGDEHQIFNVIFRSTSIHIFVVAILWPTWQDKLSLFSCLHYVWTNPSFFCLKTPIHKNYLIVY